VAERDGLVHVGFQRSTVQDDSGVREDLDADLLVVLVFDDAMLSFIIELLPDAQTVETDVGLLLAAELVGALLEVVDEAAGETGVVVHVHEERRLLVVA